VFGLHERNILPLKAEMLCSEIPSSAPYRQPRAARRDGPFHHRTSYIQSRRNSTARRPSVPTSAHLVS